MTDRPYFFFGTLMDPDVLRLVLGRDPGPFAAAAILHGFERVRVEGESYPALAAAPAGRVEGVLLRGYTAGDDLRIRYFEDFDFTIERCEVHTAAGAETAYFCGAVRNIAPTDLPWSYVDWAASEKEKFLQVARIYMAAYGELEGEAADRLWLDTVEEVFGR